MLRAEQHQGRRRRGRGKDREGLREGLRPDDRQAWRYAPPPIACSSSLNPRLEDPVTTDEWNRLKALAEASGRSDDPFWVPGSES